MFGVHYSSAINRTEKGRWLSAANAVRSVSKPRPVNTVASIPFLLRKNHSMTYKQAAECCERSEQCIEAPAVQHGRFDIIFATQKSLSDPKQVPECCAEGAVYRRHRHLFRSLRYNFCYAKITQRPTSRQGWERYEPPAVPMVFRPAEAPEGSPTHGRARARGTRARAKPRHPPRRI